MVNKLDPNALKIGAWLYKIDFLKNEIDKLEKLENFPIIRISTFLLKSQLIEFELKQKLFSIDLHLYTHNNSKLFKNRVRTPREMEGWTLGRLVYQYELLRGKEIDVLNSNLEKLVRLRNDFTHHLFSIDKDTKKMTEDSDRGIKIANKVLDLLKDLDSKLK
jgi:hypothetical protein